MKIIHVVLCVNTCSTFSLSTLFLREHLDISIAYLPQNVNKLEAAIRLESRLECTNVPKIMVRRSFVAKAQ